MTEFFDRVGTAVSPQTKAENADVASPTAPDAPRHPEGARRSWAEADGIFWGVAQSCPRLPAGLYRMEISPSVGPIFIQQKNDTDELVEFPEGDSGLVLDEIRVFRGLREKFRSPGFLYKRGIMLWGPPGSGKSCTLQLIIRLLVSVHDGVAVVVERPSIAATCLQALRRLEPDRQVVAILEDLDALCERYGQSEYLALLDGESQIDNVVYVATTNYPERLDARFVDRPSRFDTIRYIGMPSPKARRIYFNAKLPVSSPELVDDYVAATEGYSIAYLRELIILTQCFGLTTEQATARLDAMRRKKPASDK